MCSMHVKRWHLFYRHDEFLFRETKFCVPMCSLRELLVREAHAGTFWCSEDFRNFA
jgi:hypothetical protein